DRFLGQDVAFRRAGGAIEGAKAAVLRAEVGVVDIAIDDVADHTFGVPLAADAVGFHADGDEVVGVEQVEGCLAGDHSGSAYDPRIAGRRYRTAAFCCGVMRRRRRVGPAVRLQRKDRWRSEERRVGKEWRSRWS